MKSSFLIFSSAVVGFYTPAIYALLLVLMVTLLDTMWGLKLAKLNKKEITSNRFSDFFAKLVGYAVFITIGVVINYEFKTPYIVWVFSVVPIYTEIFSIDEKQRKLGKKGIIKEICNAYNFAVSIKNKRDKLR